MSHSQAAPSPRSRSLGARLALGALVWIMVALALAGWGLRNLFKEHITQQLQTQLVLHLNQLSAATSVGADGKIDVLPIASDPRFDKPLSGLYWQVDELRLDEHKQALVARDAIARSRSLWDQSLSLPRIADFAERGRSYSAVTLNDSEGHLLVGVSRNLQLPEADAPPLRLTVAADSALTSEPLRRFTSMLLLSLGVLALGLVIAVLVQLRLALKPLEQLRQGLSSVLSGQSPQLEGSFPRELQPLVNEFNTVLHTNAEIVQRARTQAGNLAHAVHTPLAIMSNAATHEQGSFARLVQEQTGMARRQVDHHLARARAATAARTSGLRTPVGIHLHALVRTMQRLHADRQIDFVLGDIDEQLGFRGEEQDFYELLGNLIDNAGKWARSRVEIQAGMHDAANIFISIDDDGPGMSSEQSEQAFQRGVRLDEKQPGSGLGLNIVRELAQTYGGNVEARRSPLGGLRMRLQLPANPVMASR